MAGEHRTTIDAVGAPLEELNERIHSFDFVAAVRQLECAFPEKPRVGESVRLRDDVVRLSQHVHLGFQGRTLESLQSGNGAHEHRLFVNFFGLLGSHGPMPLHFTEYADQRDRHHSDPTFKEFLDLFNHRLLSLFYRASVQFDPAVSFDRPGDNTYDEVLGALCGLLPAASHGRDSISDNAKRHYPAWMSSASKSPDGIAAIVEDYFDLPAAVEEWVGAWLPLPDNAQVKLGARSSNAQLGRALYIGRRVWSVRHKFNVRLGPLDWGTFSSFKPGGLRAKRLHDLVRNYVGDEWEWDLELILKPDEIKPLRLNRQSALGFDSWAGNVNRHQLVGRTVLLNRKVIGQVAA